MFNLLQFGTPWSDGREGVTQCPIVPGDTFKYKFKVERVCITCQQSETSLQLTLIKTHTHTQRSNNDLFSSLVVNLFYNLIIIHVLCTRLELICIMRTMECKEMQGYMDQSKYHFLMEFQDHLPMIMIGASSLMIGTTKAFLNKLLDCPPFPLFGLGSLRYSLYHM